MRMSAKICFVAVLLVATSGVVGSDGTESPFSFGAGARELALGGACVTDPADATSVFWNPSRLTSAQRLSITGMHSELLFDGSIYQYFGVTVPTLDLGGFGVGLFRQSIQNIEKRDDRDTYLNEFDDSQLRLYLGYGRRLGQFELGASLSLDHQSIDTYQATSSPGLTLAATHRRDPAQAWLTDVTISAVARCLLKPGIKLADETYRYPTVLEVSGSVGIVQPHSTDHAVAPYLTLRKAESIPVELYAGLEYTYKELLKLRGGFRQKNFSFGAGLDLGVVSFDYALVDRDLDFIHLFALTGSFGLTVDERRKNRADRQEADFRRAMNTQMQERNLALIDEVLAEGHKQLSAKMYDDAAGSFDRLVFLARSAGLDDAEYQRLLDSAIELRSSAETAQLLQAAVDSAQSSFATGDYLSARYHAQTALETDSTCQQARELFEQADQKVQAEAERTEYVSEQLGRVDGMLDSHRLGQAELIIQSLIEIAPDDEAVMRRVNRLELERLRRKIAEMEAERSDSTGMSSASTRTGVDSELSDSTPAEAKARPLSPEELAEVDRMYQEAKQLFNNGDIRAAVARWETVVVQSPDYQSVKEFLVKAYTFLGLELYGQKQRAKAIAVWRKALALDPDNVDIADYIERAETQMKKLEELAHEQS